MAKVDTVYSLFGMKSPQQVARERLTQQQNIMKQYQRDPFQSAGAAIGMGLARLFGGPDEELQKAQELEAIQREYQPGNIQNMAETYTRLKEAGAPAETLNRLSQDITTASEAFNKRAQAQRAQSAAVEYVSKYDPEMAKLVAANPDAAAKAIETVNKRLEGKVVGDSLVVPKAGGGVDVLYTKPNKPGETFRILTETERKERNLPPAIYQINESTEKVSALANIPTPAEPTLPAGYRGVYEVNAQGQSILKSAEPIPGTPQADALKAEQDRVNKGLAASDKIVSVVTDNIADARKLLQDPEAWVAGKKAALVEIGGALTGGFLEAGTDVQTLKMKYDTIKANIAFNKLQEIREASKTGGALGNVSNFEVGRLEAVLGKLEPTSKRAEQLASLDEIEMQFERTARAVANDLTNEQMEAAGFTPAQIQMYASYRTAERQPDGTYKNLPTAQAEPAFNFDALPQDVKDVWDDMNDNQKKLFGWNP